MSDTLKPVKQFYEHHLKRYGKEDIRGMGWFEEEDYSKRFIIATKDLDLSNSTILDVGCGFGGLYKHLVSSNAKKFSYVGVDILPKMIEVASKNFPNAEFRVANILEEDVGRFDYVFCIGALNIDFPQMKNFFYDMVSKMVRIAKKGVVINFLSDSSYLVAGPYHFENPNKLKKRLEKEFSVSIDVVNDKDVLGESFVFISKD